MTDSIVCLDIDERTSRDAFERLVVQAKGFVFTDKEPSQAHLYAASLGEDPDADLELVSRMLTDNPDLEVFLFAAKADAGLVMRAMRTGVREFFQMPFEDQEVVEALKRFKARRQRACQDTAQAVPGPRGSIVGIMGSKGGVGTTTIAVNMAVTSARAGKSTVLVDLNVPYGEVSLFLDLRPKYTWGDAVRDISRLDAAFLESILVEHESGLKVLAAPPSMEDIAPLAGEGMERILSFLLASFEVVVVDMGIYLDDVALRVIEREGPILVACVQNLACMANMRRLIEAIERLGKVPENKLRIVVNRFLKESDLPPEDIKEGLGLGPSYRIANDYLSTMSAMNQGKPLHDAAPKSAATKQIEAMAVDLLGLKKGKGGLFAGIFKGKAKA